MTRRGAVAMVALALATSLVGGCAHRLPPTREDLAKAPAAVAMLDGREVRYLDTDPQGVRSGPPLLLVHGWASDASVWWKQLAPLSAERRVLAVDLPAHGGSEPPEGAHDMDLHAAALAAVLESAGVERAVVVGHSNGVASARQLFRRSPDAVAGLVLVDGPLKKMVGDEAAERFLAVLRSDDWRSSVARFVDSMPPGGLSEADRASIRRMALSQSHVAVVGGFEAAVDDRIWEPDPIRVPTLVLQAEQPAWDEKHEAFVREIVPDLDYRTWRDVSHFLMVERPDEFNAVVLEFARTRASSP